MGKRIKKRYVAGVYLERHEYAAIAVLRYNGYKVTLLSPSKTKGVKTADLNMNGLDWELKSPIVAKKSALEHIFRKAARQSENVIFDLARLSGDETAHIRELRRLLTQSRRVK